MSQTRTDAENQRMLQAAKANFDTLRTEKIRAEDEVARAEDELKRQKAEALERYGTDDPEKLLQMTETARQRNTAAVDSFIASVNDVRQRLQAIATGQ